MAHDHGLRPFYLTVADGQLRLHRAGEGADLVVLAGPLWAASVLAQDLAARCPGWRVTTIEPPGIGGSASHPADTVAAIGAAVAAAIDALRLGPFALAACDFATSFLGATLAALGSRPAAVLAQGTHLVDACVRQGITPPDLAPKTDGSQFLALWTFLRDRHVLEPDDPRQASPVGDALPTPEQLAAAHVAAAVEPENFARLWHLALQANRQPVPGVTAIARLQDVPGALAGVSLPAGRSPVPNAAPLPGSTIWHDEVLTARGRMHLRRAGGAGRPLLVIPTGGGSSSQFGPVVAGLSAGRQAFSVDYLGNGLSEKSARACSIEELAEDMAALIDAMGFDRVDVWGSHTGANVGLELAVRYPAKVGRLIAEGPVFVSQAFQDDLLARYFPSFAPDKWGTHLNRAFHWRRDMFLFWPWYADRRDAVRRLGLPSPRDLHDYTIGILESGATYAGAYAAAFRYDTRSRLPLLRRPALVCAGPNDMLINSLDETRALAVPGVEVSLTPTTVWWPDPEPKAAAATLALYRGFLDR